MEQGCSSSERPFIAQAPSTPQRAAAPAAGPAAAQVEAAGRQRHLCATSSHFDNLSDQYDAYAEKRLAYLEAVDAAIIAQVVGKGPCRYLDVGCGTGRLLEKLRRAAPSCRGTGIDISPQMVAICQAKGLDVQVTDFFAFQPPVPFDVVFLEFNVFGYLLVQNGLAATVHHLRRLAGDRGTVVFDVLNPWCLTYGHLRQTVPTALARCRSLLANGGVCQFTYSVGGHPVTMGLARPGMIEAQFQAAGYRATRHLIKYADHPWLRPLPRLLSSQILFVFAR
ncbi:MAG: methyltransferase [Thermodesulfobacteriota bacterium]